MFKREENERKSISLKNYSSFLQKKAKKQNLRGGQKRCCLLLALARRFSPLFSLSLSHHTQKPQRAAVAVQEVKETLFLLFLSLCLFSSFFSLSSLCLKWKNSSFQPPSSTRSRRRRRQRVAVAPDGNPAVDAVEAELDRGARLGRQRLGEEGGEEELGRVAGEDRRRAACLVAISCFCVAGFFVDSFLCNGKEERRRVREKERAGRKKFQKEIQNFKKKIHSHR